MVISLTTWAILDPPAQTVPERTIGVFHRGHRASYTLPAEYETSILPGLVVFAWMLYLQGGIPLCLLPWEKGII